MVLARSDHRRCGAQLLFLGRGQGGVDERRLDDHLPALEGQVWMGLSIVAKHLVARQRAVLVLVDLRDDSRGEPASPFAL